jgi:lipopolysaccharide export system permease protein
MSSPTISRLLKRDVYSATGIVLLAFISLFWFFDFVRELGQIGQGDYKLRHAVLLTLLRIPGSVASELMPVAVLIGAVYSMARLASNSEFTILRSAGMSPSSALARLLQLGIAIVLLTVFIGEVVAPKADELAQNIALKAKGKGVSARLASGHWVRNVREQDKTVENINVLADKSGRITQLVIYRYNDKAELVLRAQSTSVSPLANNQWLLKDVGLAEPKADQIVFSRRTEWTWDSSIASDVLNVPTGSPEDMTIASLWSTTSHLKKSGQSADRHELALWKRLVNPMSAFIMLALALPFAYLNARSGGVSIKVFGGIMLGLGFVLLNGLFSQFGLLNTWPAPVIAIVPSALFVLIAVIALHRVTRVS